jgi:hypothetical protein
MTILERVDEIIDRSTITNETVRNTKAHLCEVVEDPLATAVAQFVGALTKAAIEDLSRGGQGHLSLPGILWDVIQGESNIAFNTKTLGHFLLEVADAVLEPHGFCARSLELPHEGVAGITINVTLADGTRELLSERLLSVAWKLADEVAP